MYQHIDNLIIKYYTSEDGIGKENFYTGMRPGEYSFCYDGVDFKCDKNKTFFRAVLTKENSDLSIRLTPQKTPIIYPQQMNKKNSIKWSFFSFE